MSYIILGLWVVPWTTAKRHKRDDYGVWYTYFSGIIGHLGAVNLWHASKEAAWVNMIWCTKGAMERDCFPHHCKCQIQFCWQMPFNLVYLACSCDCSVSCTSYFQHCLMEVFSILIADCINVLQADIWVCFLFLASAGTCLKLCVSRHHRFQTMFSFSV